MEKTEEHFQEAVRENKLSFRAVDPDQDGRCILLFRPVSYWNYMISIYIVFDFRHYVLITQIYSWLLLEKWKRNFTLICSICALSGHVTWDEYRVKFLASKGFNEKEVAEKIKNNEELKVDEESKL